MPRTRVLVQGICPDVSDLFSIEEEWAYVNSMPTTSNDIQEESRYPVLGDAIWTLDRIKESGRMQEAIRLLPRDDDSLKDVYIPDIYDPVHSEEVILPAMRTAWFRVRRKPGGTEGTVPATILVVYTRPIMPQIQENHKGPPRLKNDPVFLTGSSGSVLLDSPPELAIDSGNHLYHATDRYRRNNMKSYYKASLTGIALALLLAVLAGCGTTSELYAGGSEKEEPVKDGEIAVSTVEELLEAVRPGAKIILEPGRYDLSSFAEEAAAQGREFSKDGKEYVRLRECFDGVEIVIQGVKGLSIRAGSGDISATELIVSPRYAAVLNFEDCDQLSLTGLTMGHTEQGYCMGNVISLSYCRGVVLDRLDLYGCGVYGLALDNGSGDVRISNSTIRDCSEGPFSIQRAVGVVEFIDCALNGSEGPGYYYQPETSDLRFIRCSFGEEESNQWYFSEEATAEDCQWSEITQYPDYSGREENAY